MELERIVAGLVEKVERRYYGKYRGIVVDNEDPARLGRLKVQVPSVLGNEVVTGWALPCVPYGGAADQGFLFIPEREAGVWVEFEEGDPEFPVWVGTFWSKPDGESELPKPNEEDEVQVPPSRKIIKTLQGHTLQFEDADDSAMVLLIDGMNGHVITLDKNGIKISDGANGNKITLDQNGTVIEDKNQNKIEMSATAINILPASVCNLGGPTAVNFVNNLPACLFTGALHSVPPMGQAKFMK